MPIIPPVSAAPYESVLISINTAKGRLNDRIETLAAVGGSILGNNDSFSLQTVNNAWHAMQERLADLGYARLVSEAIISQLPIVDSVDPGSQVWLSWVGYFDGANLFELPALPSDLAHPLKIWERWSNQNAQFGVDPMEKILGGLPSIPKTSGNRIWEWRGDAIYMPGSQRIMDLRIRYAKFLPDFADISGTRWFNEPVTIMRASDALSWFICAEFAGSRGDNASAELFTAKGESAISRIMNYDVRADQSVNIRRQSRSGRGRGSGFWW